MKNKPTVTQRMATPISDTRTPDQIKLEQIAIGHLRLSQNPDYAHDREQILHLAGVCIDASSHPESAGPVLDMIAEKLGFARDDVGFYEREV